MTQQRLYQQEILINAPVQHVWQLVATENGLRQWWGNTIHLEEKEGGRCEEWRTDGKQPAYWQGVVTLYSPPQQLTLTLRAPNDQEEGIELTTIAISLEAKGEQTRVHITQRAFGPAAAVGISTPTQSEDEAIPPVAVPLAQLTRPAPGSLPTSTSGALSSAGKIEPNVNIVNRAAIAALQQRWQTRITSLSLAAQQSLSSKGVK